MQLFQNRGDYQWSDLDISGGAMHGNLSIMKKMLRRMCITACNANGGQVIVRKRRTC